MPLPKRTVVGALTNKLGFVPGPGEDHEWYVRESGGRIVGSTHLSRGRRAVGDFELGAMARELFVRGPTFRGAISCTVNPDDFFERMREGLEAHRRSFRH